MSELLQVAEPYLMSPALSSPGPGARVREEKWLVPGDLAGAVRDWMRRHLRPDPYASGPHGDEYVTSTLYLDTPGLGILLRRPGAGCSKYRVRRYGFAGFVFLERKLRAPHRILKRRSVAPEASLGGLAEPARPGLEGAEWFVSRVRARGLTPVCLVEYERTARQCVLSGGLVRITLDHSLRARRAGCFGFEASPDTPLGRDFAILEMKYAGDLPPLLKQLLETFPAVPARLSKYREACVALGLCDAATLRAAGRPAALFLHE